MDQDTLLPDGSSAYLSTPRPETVHERRQTANRLVDLVASRLGNTRTVCRGCYIHPAVFED